MVRGLSDDVERDHYLNAIAKAIGVSRDALDQEIAENDQVRMSVRDAAGSKSARSSSIGPPSKTKNPGPIPGADVHAARHCANFSSLVTPEMLYDDQGREAAEVPEEKP